MTSDLSFKAQVPVIDANVGVGHTNVRPAPIDSPDELLAEMHRHGVERALIYHQQGNILSPISANEFLREWLEGHEDVFIPQWMAGPEPDSLAQLRELRAAGEVSNVRFHESGASGVPFVDWVYCDILDWLQEEQIPVWISLHDHWDSTWTQRSNTPVTEIMDILAAYPDLIAVLVGAHYNHSHYVRPFLKRPNTYVDLSRYEVLRAIEELVDEFGPDRLLYGSFYPRLAMGPMLYYIHTLGFEEATLEAICAGNLLRLLKGGRK